jgi:hypothetical protein
MLLVMSEQDKQSEALEAMKLHLGGNLIFKYSMSVDGGGQYRAIYHCYEVDKKGVACPFQASIWSHGPWEGIRKKWTAWVRITSSKTNRKEKDLATHNHANVATKQVGLSQDLKDYIKEYLPKGKKRETTMSEQLLIENLKAVLLETPDRKHIATDDNKWETFKVQV